MRGCISAPGSVATRIDAPVLVLGAGTCTYPPPTFEAEPIGGVTSTDPVTFCCTR